MVKKDEKWNGEAKPLLTVILVSDFCCLGLGVLFQIFVFSLQNKASSWVKFDWKKLTTVVSVGYVSTELMCLAHQHNARVVTIGQFTSHFFSIHCIIIFEIKFSNLNKHLTNKCYTPSPARTVTPFGNNVINHNNVFFCVLFLQRSS